MPAAVRFGPTSQIGDHESPLWISNGIGRDGRDNRHAPKLGWRWQPAHLGGVRVHLPTHHSNEQPSPVADR